MNPAVGCDGTKEKYNMTTKTITKTQAPVDVSLFGITSAAMAGIFLLLFTGFAQASVLHDSAHDTRHAIAFPCH